MVLTTLAVSLRRLTTYRFHVSSDCLSISPRSPVLFDDLIGDVLGGLVQADPCRIDDAVVSTLGRLAQALQMDAAAVWRNDPSSGASVALTHAWIKPSLATM